jgi:hypothetical protein
MDAGDRKHTSVGRCLIGSPTVGLEAPQRIEPTGLLRVTSAADYYRLMRAPNGACGASTRLSRCYDGEAATVPRNGSTSNARCKRFEQVADDLQYHGRLAHSGFGDREAVPDASDIKHPGQERPGIAQHQTGLLLARGPGQHNQRSEPQGVAEGQLGQVEDDATRVLSELTVHDVAEAVRCRHVEFSAETHDGVDSGWRNGQIELGPVHVVSL